MFGWGVSYMVAERGDVLVDLFVRSLICPVVCDTVLQLESRFFAIWAVEER
jgi:hypothetical protein